MASHGQQQKFRSKTGHFITAAKAAKGFKTFKSHVDENNNDIHKVKDEVIVQDSFLEDHNYCSKLTLMSPGAVPIKCYDKSTSDISQKFRPCVSNLPGGTLLILSGIDEITHAEFDCENNPRSFGVTHEHEGITIDWREGRRIVELSVLADGLEKGCISCCKPLSLSHCVSERHYGLGSLLYIRCNYQECGIITAIPTGKRHKGATISRTNVWDVNTKLASGMLHTGLGETSVNMLLASLNIPGISSKALKRREREAGIKIQSVAKKTCNEFAKKELELSEDNKVEVSFDAGWQKRGSGRSYNSLSGLSNITQIAAVNKTDMFSQYVLPSTPISEGATAVTGLSTDGTYLYKDGARVEACNISTAHNKFIHWISKFTKPVLVAHNSLVFDSVVLMNSLEKTYIDIQPYLW